MGNCAESARWCSGRAGIRSISAIPSTGHASIESTRIYLHLAADWLVDEYRKAMDILDGLAGSPS